MKKPRLLTPEELVLWYESNKATKVKKGATKPQVTATASAKKPPTVAKRPVTTDLPRAPRTQAPLQPLRTREANKRLKPYGAVEATLDLHGMTKLEAYTKVQQFLIRQHRQGHRHVAIITGKGRGAEMGVLRSNLPNWLNEPALRAIISGFAEARPEKGGAGVTHVLLKRA